MEIQEAFFKTLKDQVKTPQRFYICLIREEQFYGGPEEGGWWGKDRHLVAFAEFATREECEANVAAIDALAKEKSDEASSDFNRRCLAECLNAEARGIDVDTLPEVNGPDRYRVLITEVLPPEVEFGCRQYE